MDGKTILKKQKTLKFQKSLKDFNETHWWEIVFQRVNKFKYLKLVCNNVEISKGEDDEDIVIKLERMPHFDPQELDNLFESKDIESGAVINLEELSNVPEMTDSIFRNACNSASITCHKFSRFFLVAELVTKIADIIILSVLPLYVVLNLTYIHIIIMLSILIPVILSQVLCDWGKLLEKYSRLCWEFSKLSNSKEEDRSEKYQNLVYHFRSSWIYTDMIIPVDEKE